MTLRAWTNDADTCIAESLEDAMTVMQGYGYGPIDLDPDAWGAVEDDEEITIHCDATGEPATPGDPGVAPVTKTAAEWVASRGRGFLCTTEY